MGHFLCGGDTHLRAEVRVLSGPQRHPRSSVKTGNKCCLVLLTQTGVKSCWGLGLTVTAVPLRLSRGVLV
jgi:hypothetical protein